MLLSSVFVLNTKGGLDNVSLAAPEGNLALLLEMEKHLEAAAKVEKQDGENAAVQQQGVVGHPTTRPALVWLLRDCDKSTVLGDDSPDEYLEKSLCGALPSATQNRYGYSIENSDAESEGYAIRVRSQVRRVFGGERRCHALPMPTAEYNLANLGNLQYGQLELAFRGGFQRFQDDIYKLTAQVGPKRVGREFAPLTAR